MRCSVLDALESAEVGILSPKDRILRARRGKNDRISQRESFVEDPGGLESQAGREIDHAPLQHGSDRIERGGFPLELEWSA